MANTKPTIDPQQAALLASVAQSGAAGNQAQAANLQLLNQAQKAAQQAATQRADNIGAPAGMYEKQAAQIAEPYQTSSKDAQAAAAAYNAQIGGIGAINNSYMGQIQAAYPVINSITQGKIADINAQRDYQNQQRQWAVEDHNYQLKLRGQDDTTLDAQKNVLNSVNTAGMSQDAKDTFNSLVSQSGDFGTATTQLAAARAAIQADKTISADKKKQQLADLDAITPYVRSYYYPQYNPLPQEQSAVAPPMGPAVAGQQSQPDTGFGSSASVTNGLKVIGNGVQNINPFSSQFRNRLGNALRFR